VYNLVTGKEVRRVHGHRVGKVTGNAFLPDGKTFATGGFDGIVCLWDTATGAKLRVFEGHTRAVYCAVFTPDGAVMFTASADGSMRWWDVKSAECLGIFKGAHQAIRVRLVAGRVYAIFADRTLKVWELSALLGRAGAEATTARPATSGRLIVYVPDLPALTREALFASGSTLDDDAANAKRELACLARAAVLIATDGKSKSDVFKPEDKSWADVLRRAVGEASEAQGSGGGGELAESLRVAPAALTESKSAAAKADASLAVEAVDWVERAMRMDEDLVRRIGLDQPRCAKCGVTDVPLSRCSRCKTTQYCSVECQRAAWWYHKRARGALGCVGKGG